MKKQKILYFSFLLAALLLMLSGIIMVYYPSLYEENSGDKKYMYRWVAFVYIALLSFSFLMEKIIVLFTSKEKTYFKDITLEFNSLHVIMEEKEFLEKCNNIIGDHVLEISFIYNLSRYFDLERKKKSILEDNKSLGENQEQNLKILKEKNIQEIDDEIKIFIEDFRKDPVKYFTGNGFITFRNYKYAHLFKNIYNKAYKKRQLKTTLINKNTKKSFGKFKNTVNKIVLNNERKNSFSVKDVLKENDTEKDLVRNKRFTMIKKPSESINEQKRFSIRDFSKMTKLFMFENVKEIDLDSIENMKRFFGPDFKLKRGSDPLNINFDFTNSNQFSKLQKFFFIFVFILFLPSIAYYMNYLYYFYFIKRHLLKSFAEIWMEYSALIGAVVLDFISLSLIQIFFDQKYFFKSSKMLFYKLGFSCFYILLSNIIIPNFALKSAFFEFSEKLDQEQKIKTINFLINSLYMNFYLLMFSGINFKIINPFILNKYILKNSVQKSENDHIIFSLSFLINCIFQISFYCTITPDVHLYFCLYILLFFIFDYFLESKKLLEKTDKKINMKLPYTIFSNGLMILICGIFPVCCLGYYGLSLSFQELMKSPQKNEGYLNLIFEKLSTFISIFAGLFNIAPTNQYEKNFYYLLLIYTKNILSQFFYLLITDITFSLSFMSYVVFCVLFIQLYLNDKFLNRLQSKIWGDKKIENIKFVGQSFREINPAYKLLGKNISLLTGYRDKVENN